MPKVQYNISIKNIEKSTQVDSGHFMPGDYIPSIEGSSKISINNYNSIVEDGWLEEPVMEDLEDKTILWSGILKQDGLLLHTPISGPFALANNQVRLDSDKFTDVLDYEYVLGFQSPSIDINPIGLTYRRTDDRIEIWQDYKYTPYESIIDKLPTRNITGIEVDDKKYILTALQNPTSAAQAKEAQNIEIELVDYYLASQSYTDLCSKYSIEEDQFLEYCDYISSQSLGLIPGELIGTSTTISIKTKFFPIYNYVSLLLHTSSGIKQIGPENVDTVYGSIDVSSEALQTHDDILGFYIFYGVVPAIYLNPPNTIVKYSDILSKDSSITHLGINNIDSIRDIYTSTNLVNIRANLAEEDNESLIVQANAAYKEIFFEPESNVVINGELVQVGEAFRIDNAVKNFVNIKAPHSVVDLVENAYISNNRVMLNNDILDSNLVLFGNFEIAEMNRLALMSFLDTNATINQDPDSSTNLTVSTGFGGGVFSEGVFNRGLYRSTYDIMGGQGLPTEERLLQELAVTVVPSQYGYEIILPLWADKSSIQVHELDKNMTRTSVFRNWTYIEPDLVILDKNHTKRNKHYVISFKPVASFAIRDVNIYKNYMDIITSTNIFNNFIYLKGLKVLSNKRYNIKVGYIDSHGNKVYTRKNITVNQYINQEFIKEIISGYKSIIF